ncbi:EMC3/TMCO1 family protein [Bacteroidota bacterium]
MLEGLLNPVFNPLLDLGYFWAILIISFVLTLLITLIYKYVTDQELMKSLKTEMKELQKELKQLTKTNPSKAMAHQKKVMEKNMQYMKHSFKPTLYTFIPIIIIFGWLNSHMAYIPIEPNTPFIVTAEFAEGTFGEVSLSALPELNITSEAIQEIENSQASWTISGDEGEYLLKVIYDNREFEKDLLITSEREYAEPIKAIKDSNLKKIVVGNEKVLPFHDIGLNVNLSWIWTYIILSLVFSFGLRKLLKIS